MKTSTCKVVFIVYGILDNVFQGIKDVRYTQEDAITAGIKWVMRQAPSPNVRLSICSEGVETQDGLIMARVEKRLAR